MAGICLLFGFIGCFEFGIYDVSGLSCLVDKLLHLLFSFVMRLLLFRLLIWLGLVFACCFFVGACLFGY